jgi:DNA primase
VPNGSALGTPLRCGRASLSGRGRRLPDVAGRIRDEDIALVRERSPIADVVSEHVTLRNAGGGSLKGLCPFHDEKSPSFNVNPSKNFFHCFGCGEGGDVIDFVMKIDHLPFGEAIERLANRAGVQLRYEEGGFTPRRDQGQRSRLIQAHQAAAQFYAEQLTSSPEAGIGRRFLDERGFDPDAAALFGVGYAPKGWDVLTTHLRGRGFSNEELVTGGLAREGQRGLIDRFMGRLVWPLRDITGDVVGFGARRLYDDDRIEAKYLNTPESPIYKKSQVLYGIDLAKKEIARRMQAVIVEGYTDVMACHLSGVPTAVATCGTAFGAEHAKVLRRLLMDQDAFRGELIFTFDGDEAGQKAARRAFEEHDQRFVTQTFVSVEPDGLDPCELRQKKGDAAVRDLIARRLPLFEFAIRGSLARYDLETPEGRVGALHAAAPVVVRIRDRALRQEYGRRLAGWLGMEVDDVMGRLASLARGGQSEAAPAARRPDPRDPALHVQREVLKVALQFPQLAGPLYDGLERSVFTAEPYAAVHDAILAAGGTATATAGEAWVNRVREQVTGDDARSLVAELAVDPMRVAGEPDRAYAADQVAALQAAAVTRRAAELKSRLQRVNPLEETDLYNRLFGELIALEQYAKGLRERAIDAI